MNPENSFADGGHKVFISYSTNDEEIADKIRHGLEQNGLKCWISHNSIPSGNNYIDEIADAIKSTKIVLLVFSKSSQESKYVNNEINMAYSHDKPILSVNIDDTMPEDEMEYYLKVTQWLTVFPNPENHLETIVEDALKLCNQKRDAPVSVDLSNFKHEDLSRHKKDYPHLLFFTPVYWVSFLYMGIVAAKKLWVLMGFLYFIPTLMCLIIYFQIPGFLFLYYPMMVLFSVIFIMFWVLAIIHGLLIRNEFLTRKSVLRFTSSDDELFDYLYDEYVKL